MVGWLVLRVRALWIVCSEHRTRATTFLFTLEIDGDGSTERPFADRRLQSMTVLRGFLCVPGLVARRFGCGLLRVDVELSWHSANQSRLDDDFRYEGLLLGPYTDGLSLRDALGWLLQIRRYFRGQDGPELGESEQPGARAMSGSPIDGAAVEITAILYSNTEVGCFSQ